MSDRAPPPKNLVLDVLSSAQGQEVSVGVLVAVADVFDISSNRLRVALSRLRASGVVRCENRGHYTLSPNAEHRNRQVLSWRTIEDQLVPWRDHWLGVAVQTPEPDEAHALRLMGFQRWEAGLHIRPDNLEGSVSTARAKLFELGLSQRRPVFRLDSLSAEESRRARGLWPIASQAKALASLEKRLQESLQSWKTREAKAVLRESFLLGGQAIRQLALDPRLPDSIAKPGPRRALARRMQAYDKKGRARWSAYLNLPSDAPLSESPVDQSSFQPEVR